MNDYREGPSLSVLSFLPGRRTQHGTLGVGRSWSSPSRTLNRIADQIGYGCLYQEVHKVKKKASRAPDKRGKVACACFRNWSQEPCISNLHRLLQVAGVEASSLDNRVERFAGPPPCGRHRPVRSTLGLLDVLTQAAFTFSTSHRYAPTRNCSTRTQNSERRRGVS